MAEEAGYLLGEEEVRRIAKSVVYTEQRNRNHPSRRRRHVIKDPSIIIGKADSAISKGTSGTISVWHGTPGSETDSGQNITAHNKFAAVVSGAWVAASHNGFGFYLIATEC